jgi:prolyl-tRNA synthetase
MAEIPVDAGKEDKFVFAVVRGDMEVNETKLANAIKAKSLRPATEAEIIAVGAVPGYASPVGLKNALILVDEAVTTSPNLVAGANEDGYHLLNVNYGRDYNADLVTDLVSAGEGDACIQCGSPLRAVRGVEVGNIFKLGTRYSDSMGCTFLDKDGNEKPVIMGSYGIGSGRLLACIAEEHHDEKGLIWPVSVAPYQVHLVSLTGKGDPNTLQHADQLYADLQAGGIEVLYDDREESPGVKFNDADLIGLPLRLTGSERAFKQGGVEFKRRDSPEKIIVPKDKVISTVIEELNRLQNEIDAHVTLEEYSG